MVSLWSCISIELGDNVIQSVYFICAVDLSDKVFANMTHLKNMPTCICAKLKNIPIQSEIYS